MTTNGGPYMGEQASVVKGADVKQERLNAAIRVAFGVYQGGATRPLVARDRLERIVRWVQAITKVDSMSMAALAHDPTMWRFVLKAIEAEESGEPDRITEALSWLRKTKPFCEPWPVTDDLVVRVRPDPWGTVVDTPTAIGEIPIGEWVSPETAARSVGLPMPRGGLTWEVDPELPASVLGSFRFEKQRKQPPYTLDTWVGVVSPPAEAGRAGILGFIAKGRRYMVEFYEDSTLGHPRPRREPADTTYLRRMIAHHTGAQPESTRWVVGDSVPVVLRARFEADATP